MHYKKTDLSSRFSWLLPLACYKHGTLVPFAMWGVISTIRHGEAGLKEEGHLSNLLIINYGNFELNPR